MIDIESKIISYREDTNDYRLCLTREEIEEIKNVRKETIDECIAKIDTLEKISFGIVETDLVKGMLEQLKEQNK